jgi:hypothetical protein
MEMRQSKSEARKEKLQMIFPERQVAVWHVKYSGVRRRVNNSLSPAIDVVLKIANSKNNHSKCDGALQTPLA